MGTAENYPLNWRGFIKPLEYKIEQQLGPGNVPGKGKWFGRRIMIAAKLKELGERGADVVDIRKRLAALDQPASSWDDSIESQISQLDQMVDQLHEQIIHHPPTAVPTNLSKPIKN